MITARRRMFEIIEPSHGASKASTAYDVVMMLVITTSLVPLAFKTEYPAFIVIDRVCAGIFIIDYLLRWITSDFKLGKRALSFVVYPFTMMAAVDLLSVLPSFFAINGAFRVLKVVRMLRALRVLRVLKSFRYSRSVQIIADVLKKSRTPLTAVGTLAVGYILVSALVIINVEPESFGNFFDAIYWATVSLTTMGYGDIYPVTTIGRAVTMVSSMFGIAIVALPSGIITAGYMAELQNDQDTDHKDKV